MLLLEKSELTSGSTWHAAGGMHTFNGEANISRLQKYTIDLYRELEALSGQSCGLHANGGLMLAATQGELDSLQPDLLARALPRHGDRDDLARPRRSSSTRSSTRAISSARCGAPTAAIATPRARRRPTSRRRAGSAPRSSASRACTSLTQRPDGSWDVVTDKGNGARRARRQLRGPVGARGRPHGRHRAAGAGDGAPLPAHRGHPRAARAAAREIVNTTDYAGEIYMRQERGGALIGTYEPRRRRLVARADAG